MSNAEIITITIHFHQSNHRYFKNYYLGNVSKYLNSYFPQLLIYTTDIKDFFNNIFTCNSPRLKKQLIITCYLPSN